MILGLVDPSRYLFWILSRGAGTTALILASVSVCFGLLSGGRMVRGSAADRRAYHEILSLSVMVALAIHGLSLLGDTYLRPSILQIVVPFTLGYERIAVGLGIICGWSMVALGLSYYFRQRIGTRRWRTIHMFTMLAWAGGLIHACFAGTDTGHVWYIALLVITAAPVILLIGMRAAGARFTGAGRRDARGEPAGSRARDGRPPSGRSEPSPTRAQPVV